MKEVLLKALTRRKQEYNEIILSHLSESKTSGSFDY